MPLSSLAAVGPAGQRIRDAFVKSALPDAEARVTLWQHDSEVNQSLAAKPDTHITAKPANAHLAKKYWGQRSSLLLPLRLFLPTTRVISPRLNTLGLGSAWAPCKIKAGAALPIDAEKALCVYLNSSIGILAMLGDRSNRKPTYPNLSLDDLRKLTVPNIGALNADEVSSLVTVYDRYAHRILLPLPQMDADPVRRDLDDVVCTALGLDAELVSTVRRQLAAEPSVTGKRYSLPG